MVTVQGFYSDTLSDMAYNAIMNYHLFLIICLKSGKIETVNKNLLYRGNTDRRVQSLGTQV